MITQIVQNSLAYLVHCVVSYLEFRVIPRKGSGLAKSARVVPKVKSRFWHPFSWTESESNNFINSSMSESDIEQG